MSRPLLRRRALTTLISSGSVTSGVSMRSLRPYLCGLSSGSGDGAGMLGESAESRFVGRVGRGFGRVTLPSDSDWKSSTKAGWFSNLDSRLLSALESRIAVVALTGRTFSSVIVMVEAECTGSISGDFDDMLRSANGSTGLSSFSLLPASKVEDETCCVTWIAVHWTSG